MIQVTEGRIVHAVLLDKDNVQITRPAIVVKVWSQENGSCNLQVFTDGVNDFKRDDPGASGLLWATSYAYSEEPKSGTWHWPPRV